MKWHPRTMQDAIDEVVKAYTPPRLTSADPLIAPIDPGPDLSAFDLDHKGRGECGGCHVRYRPGRLVDGSKDADSKLPAYLCDGCRDRERLTAPDRAAWLEDWMRRLGAPQADRDRVSGKFHSMH